MGCAFLRRSVFRWLERDSTSMLFFFFLFFLQFLRENKQHDNHIELHLYFFLVGEAKLRFQMKKNQLSCRTARRFRESNSFPAPPPPPLGMQPLDLRTFHFYCLRLGASISFSLGFEHLRLPTLAHDSRDRSGTLELLRAPGRTRLNRF